MCLIIPPGVSIVEISMCLSQDNDTWDTDLGGQFMDIKVLDSGGGSYLVLETERWALDADDADAYAVLFKQLCGLVKDVDVKDADMRGTDVKDIDVKDTDA